MRGPRTWPFLDWIVAIYSVWIALLILVRWAHFATPATLLAAHMGIVALLWVLPARGAAWEFRSPGESPAWTATRFLLRFLRHCYPLLFALFFFEEAQQTVRAVWVEDPFWFERYLFAADRWVFGESPALLVWPAADELMHFFYFTYYLIVVGGVVFAFFGPKLKPLPAPGFERVITAVMTSYLLAYLWYPWLPARGPWEHPDVVGGLRPFEGGFFVWAIGRIIEEGSVSGACYPSGHAAGTWGAVFGLAGRYPRGAVVLSVVALGMSVACVYTRYHHVADVVAGFLMAVVGSAIAWRVTAKQA